MPIQLDDLTSFTPAAKSLTPKYFDKDILTGNGKSSGLLNSSIRPGRYPSGEGPHTLATSVLGTKSRSSASAVVTHVIPVGILTQYSVEQNAARGLTFPLPADEDLFHITEHATSLPYDAWLGLTPQGLVVTKDNSNNTGMVTESRVLYRMEVYLTPVGNKPERVTLVPRAPYQIGEGFVMMGWSYAPLDDAEDLIADATRRFSPTGNGTYVIIDDLAEWMGDYDVYDRICRLAEDWAGTGIADVVCDHITELFAAGTPNDQALNRLTSQLRFLETYPVALEAYKAIHATLTAVCPSDISSVLVKQNINLLMNHTLRELDDLKPQLPVPAPTTNGITSVNKMFSAQQRAAITADEPLVLVQSGAGTGKSSTILARIEHLITDRGVNADDITVLSFTNAAADNIKAKNPNVGSMTIAAMIHDIYSLNHPAHDLSSIDTIVNSLDIFYPTNQLARTFRRRLLETDTRRKVPGATTALNAFVEHYQAEVIEMLDTIRQTCLELEIILAYQKIDTMKEPPHVACRYLIVDEVQDNSIFEFIYTLKWVAKHKKNLFIVGDASQTLYEFRASNPKALNALEASGVFAYYQLTTNYRSNQAILDFANVHLSKIEANQIAQIRLRANSLTPITAKEFTDKVTLDYRVYPRITQFSNDLPAYVQNVFKPWVDQKLALGQQVAFLAYTRADVAAMQAALTKTYPGEEVISLVAEKTRSTTVFSEFIKGHWDEVEQVPALVNASFAVTHGIDTHLPTLLRGVDLKKARPAVINMVTQWWSETKPTFDGWVALTKQLDPTTGKPLMEAEEFFENLRGSLLRFEVSRNAIKQSLTNQRNRERKEARTRSNAKLIVSTIHGAKGLEFDNVVGLYKYDSQLDEPTKRTYYVMLTRAIHSEFVLAYGTIKRPRIEADYESIVNDLLKAEHLAALRAQGYDPDILSEDDVAAALASLQKMQQDALDAGDLDTAASLLPAPIDFTTRGVGLPAPDDEEKDSSGDEGVNDGSAFTQAKA